MSVGSAQTLPLTGPWRRSELISLRNGQLGFHRALEKESADELAGQAQHKVLACGAGRFNH